MLRGVRVVWFGLLAGMLFSTPQTATAGDTCCSIVSINNANGMVTALNVETHQTFTFVVDSRRLTASLRVGQEVYADFATGKVGFTPADPCCSITATSNGHVPAPVSEPPGTPGSDLGPYPLKQNKAAFSASPGPESVANYHKPAGIPQPDPADTCCTFTPSSRATSTGRIVLDLPGASTSRVVILSEGKTLMDRYWSHDALSFPPGDYKVFVSGAEVSVPVRKGMDTRVRAGVLKITVDGRWELYDQHGAKRLMDATGDRSFGLPVGRYQLKQNNAAFAPVEIRDNETTDF